MVTIKPRKKCTYGVTTDTDPNPLSTIAELPDYLDYTAAAAWRRINAMRLCTHTRGARELLRDGALSLSNAAQLQHAFERDQRSRRHPTRARRAAAGTPGNRSTPEPPSGAGVVAAGEQEGKRGLDAAVKEQLVQQAAGKSTREVTQMLAAVNPVLAAPHDRLRALGDGRWELKAAIDGECQRGLEQLRMLLSHVDPHLTLGKLVERLVQDGLDRYDPTRTPRRRRTTARASGTGEQAVDTQDAQTTAQRDTSAAKHETSTAKREWQLEGAAPAAVARGRDDQAALQRDRKLHARRVAAGAAAAAQRPGRTAHRGRPASGEHALPGSTDSGVQPDAQPALRRAPAGQQRALGDPATSAPKQLERSAYHAPAPVLAPHTGGNSGVAAGGPAVPSGHCTRRITSPQKPAVPPPGTVAAGLHTTPRDRSATAPRRSASQARSAARPGARSRYIPAAVRREVWRRDQGCCSYVDRHSGRRCGSRYRLEIDHIVPFALGGDAQPANLRLRCKAHHRYRATRHAARTERRESGAGPGRPGRSRLRPNRPRA